MVEFSPGKHPKFVCIEIRKYIVSEIHCILKIETLLSNHFMQDLNVFAGTIKNFINLKLTQIEAIYNFELKKEIYMYLSVDSWLHIS